MDVQRSTKHRSLGIDSKPQPVKIKRPSIGERHKSAPLVVRARQPQAQPIASTVGSRKTNNSDQLADATGLADNCPIVNLVVIGNARAGKTTFIRNALHLDKSATAPISSTRLILNATQYLIQVCELDLDDVDFSDGRPLKWPPYVGNVSFPSVDGVLCLYDITDEDSIVGVPQALYVLSKAKLPITLVACKADAPISEQEVGITFVERVRRSFPLVNTCESSSASIDSIRKCLSIALKAISAINKLKVLMEENQEQDDRELEPTVMRVRTADFDRKHDMSAAPQTPLSDGDSMSDEAIETRGKLGDNMAQQSFLQSDGDSSSTGSISPSEDSLLRLKSAENIREDGSGEGGVPFSDLIDRLLKLPVTRSDSRFVPAFLCLYRSFATPKALLTEIIDRFVTTEESEMVALAKVAELLRYLQVLAHWTAKYPGDFAASSTRRLALSFAHDLEQSKNFRPAATEIIGNLLTIIMDDDRDWAFKGDEEYDMPDSRRTTMSSFSIGKGDASQDAASDYSDGDKDARRRSTRNSGSYSVTSSIFRSSTTSSSATNLFNLDAAREQSRNLKAVPHIPLTRLQWDQFMATPTADLAREITRMDWIMYSAIRARDFVRHVSLSSQQRARLKHSDTIGMMVRHFNHLALFVSGMILHRDKPKYRAKILEKFMELAWKVRQLNNYNSLGAIVAGITGPEISRLKQTWELVPNEVQKQFLRLTVLMSISRSHAAYRMAWENSFNERIPFIPLVRQDLTMAATANQTFIGKNVNWKKFEIMGDVIVGIQRSHDQPYSFPEKTQKTNDLTRLILDTRVIIEQEDDADPRSELYDRSVHLEPNSQGDSRKSMANFGVKRTMSGWFQS